MMMYNYACFVTVDGSEPAYGSVGYFKFSWSNECICTIVMAKVRLTPLNRTSLKTIPHIELNAAKLDVYLYLKITSEIDFQSNSVYF